MNCACLAVIPDSLAYLPGLRPDFEREIGDDVRKLEGFLHDLVKRSNMVRSRAAMDMVSEAHAQEPPPSSICFDTASVEINEYGDGTVDIEYQHHGTMCDEELMTQWLRFGLDLEYTSSANGESAIILPSGTSLEFGRTGEILKVKSEDSKESSIDDMAKRFIHSTFRAAWSTFDRSGQLDNSTFFDNAFPDGVVSRTSSLTQVESGFMVSLENWLALHRQQR
jgi:hypothetical protein